MAGDGRFRTFDVDSNVVIGRAPECDVTIEYDHLSRRHVLLRPGARTTVQDLGSKNGTRAGGRVLHGGDPLELGPGESFQVGPLTFLLVGRGGLSSHSSSLRDRFRIVDPTPAGAPAALAELAASRTSVLILGETGVGKEVLAETLHALSRRPGPLTRINCAALSESLLESELFGHEKGAFTGAGAPKLGLLEASQDGTVFLDEVGELPLTIQAKLLRAVERREVIRLGSVKPREIDVRFIAATNRDLPGEVEAGRFRRDLFFRLDGVTLTIPPLRERRGLIAPLALRFLAQATGQPARLTPLVLAALHSYAWPGNVRELRSVIERAVLLARGGEIGVRHLAFTRRTAADEPPPRPPDPPAGPSGEGELDRDDRARVLAALDSCAGNQTRAAKLLGIGRTTLLKKLDLYRIQRPRR